MMLRNLGWQVVLAIGVGLMILQATGFGTLSYVWIFTILFILGGLFPLVIESYKGKFDLLNVRNAFVIYYLLQFGGYTIYLLSGLQEREHGTAFLSVTTHTDEILTSIFYATLGLAFYYIGYWSGWWRPLVATLAKREKRMEPIRCTLAICALAFVALLAFARLVQLRGGFSYYVTHLLELRSERLLGVGFLFYGLVPLSIAFLLCYVASTGDRKFAPAAYILFVLAIGISLLAGFRHMTVHTLVYGFVAHHYLVRRLKLSLRLVLILALIFSINMAYLEYRSRPAATIGEALAQTGEGLEPQRFSRLLVEATIARFHGTVSMVRILDRIDLVGYQWGRYFITDLLVFPIPRFLWPEKPLSSGFIFNQLFFSDIIPRDSTAAVVPTLLGELYWIFSLPGIIFGMFCIGVFSRTVYELVRSHPGPRTVVIYAISFWALVFANETISLHTAAYLFSLILALLTLRFVQVRRFKTVRSSTQFQSLLIRTGNRKE